MIAKLHYISQATHNKSHADNIKEALDAGCRWIQLRIKDSTENVVLEEAFKSRELCNSYGAKLIINDNPHIAKKVGADGLHLGLKDMPIPEAKLITGNEMLIGGTANTFEDIKRRIEERADYIGLGPYRFTTTKANLSPVLGLEGYKNILEKMKEHKFSIPIIAIGGITINDIPLLAEAGVYGVAISGLITNTTDKRNVVERIDELMTDTVSEIARRFAQI